MCFLNKNLLPQRNRVKDITNTLNEEWTLVFLIFFILTVVSSKFSFKISEFCFFTDSYRIVVTSLFCLSHYAILALFDSNKKDARDQFLLQYFQNKKKTIENSPKQLVESSPKLAIERTAPNSLYYNVVSIAGHYFTVIIEDL